MSKEAPRSLTLKRLLIPLAVAGSIGIPGLACGITAWANELQFSMVDPPRFTPSLVGLYGWGHYEISGRSGVNTWELEFGVGDFASVTLHTRSLLDPNAGSMYGVDLNLGNYCGGLTQIDEEGIKNPMPGGFCLPRK